MTQYDRGERWRASFCSIHSSSISISDGGSIFGLGAIVGIAVLIVRRALPESPRWLMTHGRVEEAERVVEAIEREAGAGAVPTIAGRITLDRLRRVTFGQIIGTLVRAGPIGARSLSDSR